VTLTWPGLTWPGLTCALRLTIHKGCSRESVFFVANIYDGYVFDAQSSVCIFIVGKAPYVIKCSISCYTRKKNYRSASAERLGRSMCIYSVE